MLGGSKQKCWGGGGGSKQKLEGKRKGMKEERQRDLYLYKNQLPFCQSPLIAEPLFSSCCKRLKCCLWGHSRPIFGGKERGKQRDKKQTPLNCALDLAEPPGMK